MSYANNDFAGNRRDNFDNPSYDNTTGTGDFDRRDDLGATRQDRLGGQDRFADNVTGTGNYDTNYGSSGTGVGPHGVRQADRFDNSGERFGVQDRFDNSRLDHGTTGTGMTGGVGIADRFDNTDSNRSSGLAGERRHGEHHHGEHRLGEHRVGDDFSGDNTYRSSGARGEHYDRSNVDNFGRDDTAGAGYGTDATGRKPTMGEKLKGTMEVMTGKMTGNPAKVEQGRERKAGELGNNVGEIQY